MVFEPFYQIESSFAGAAGEEPSRARAFTVISRGLCSSVVRDCGAQNQLSMST